MLRNSAEIVSLLKSNKSLLQEKYPISELALFGSYVRGDQKDNSDIDILVDFDGKIRLGFIKLAHDLEDLLGSRIDLVHKRAIKPKYWTFIQKDIVYV